MIKLENQFMDICDGCPRMIAVASSFFHGLMETLLYL